MLKLKTFVKKTRRGKIMKVVREHYLRDDLACGVENCVKCRNDADGENDEDSATPKCVISAEPTSKCDLFPKPHYLVLVKLID
jgi:exosome complex exonuclease DIS3/RRP44